MNFGEYIKRPMTGETTKPKILLYNSPIPFIRSVVDTLTPEFDFIFTGDGEQLNETILANPDISVILVCETESLDQGKDILERTKSLLPNAARGILLEDTTANESRVLLQKDFANQLLPSNISADVLATRLLELAQVNKLKWQVSEIEKIAITDPTTGLPNGCFFQSSMEVLIDKNLGTKTPFGLILVDIDQFRSFNETFGYGEGDKILESMGGRIRTLIPDCLNIFRLSSDEFAVLVKIQNGPKAHQLGELIRQEFERGPFLGPNRRPAYMTVSVGVAVFPDHGVVYSEIMTTAKGALNQAKRRGRNQTVVSQLC